jgi:hypothetical protein
MHCYEVTFNTLSLLYKYMQNSNTIADMSSIRISHDIKGKLVKIGAKLSLKDGKNRSMEDIIKLLIKHYEDYRDEN